MKWLLMAFLLLMSSGIFSQKINIIPAPVKIRTEPGSFALSDKTALILNDSGEKATADFLNDYLQRFYGFKLSIVPQAKDNYIRFNTLRFIKAPENEAHYTLKVTEQNISIEGDSYQGTFYGMQTLLQLLPVKSPAPVRLACMFINDYPRFAYRGMHLDVSRHFFNVDFIKKYIDYLALHKMNTFHWHLTDDQGWRIEIKKYPNLTATAAYRNGTIIGRYPGTGNDSIKYGGFYTQDEIRDVVQYAAKRYITIIPEIEMPGHSRAALAAYPELGCTGGPYEVQQTWGGFYDVFCAGNEKTFTFLQDVLDEVIELFPSKYIHIGGDESPKIRWQKCPKCQKRIADNGLKDEHELQSYFIRRIEKYLNSKGRNIIGWDEILEGGLAPNATVMSWRGEKRGIEAANQNHRVIMTPENYLYFDHAQSRYEDSLTMGRYTPVEEVYGYDPLPKELSPEKATYVYGSQANVWTEYISNERKVEYTVFPRMSALSEVLWSPKESRDWKDFESRLLYQFKRFDLWQANYSKAYFDLSSDVLPAKNNDGILWSLKSRNNIGQIFITDNNTNAGLKYVDTLLISNSADLEAALVDGRKTLSALRLKFSFNKATGKKIAISSAPSATYPGNGGIFGLVNGLTSDRGFNSPEWLGWFGKDVQAVIDLSKNQKISRVGINVWKQEPSYVFLPKSVEVYTSLNGTDWSNHAVATPVNGKWPNERKITVSLDQPAEARYIKVMVANSGPIPAGKAGAGRNTWLFIDEIEAE